MHKYEMVATAINKQLGMKHPWGYNLKVTMFKQHGEKQRHHQKNISIITTKSSNAQTPRLICSNEEVRSTNINIIIISKMERKMFCKPLRERMVDIHRRISYVFHVFLVAGLA